MILPRPLLGAILVVTLFLPGCNRGSSTFDNAPVIVISVDTLRADRLPAYGSDRVSTPAIDRLAADGIVYENAYAHVPLTLPSHVTMLSGTLPWQAGVRDNVGYRFDPKSSPTLPKLLSAHGYATGAAVSSYVLRSETGIGPLFDWYDDSIEVDASAALSALQRPGGDTVRSALSWIDRMKGRPFFLFLHLYEPHTPYEPVEPFRSRYSDRYDGEIATADAIVGQLLDALAQRDLYDQATIILLSDHGEGLGDHGESEHGVLLYREALHVPLIVKLPGKRMSGRRVSAPAQMIDLFPTVLSLVGAKLPEGLEGTSLIDLAMGRGPAHRTVYSETLYPRIHLGWSELRSLIDSRLHYIEGPQPELFDFVSDPAEKTNLRDRRRRESFERSRLLSSVPLNLVAPQSADPEERARLSALGYLAGAAAEVKGPRLNPRDHIDAVTRVQKCGELGSEGRHQEGVNVCRELIRDYPDLVDAYSRLAANLRSLGRLDEALEAYREAIRRAPQVVDLLALEIAKVELDRGNLEAASLNARQAMKLSPLEAHLILAAVALERRELVTAESEARQALGDLPRIPAQIMLARVLVEQGKVEEALALTDGAAARIAQRKARPVATLASTRGDILARLGRVREAEAAFRQEIAQFPATRQAYVRLAILLAQEHRFSEIEPTLQAMIAETPTPATYRLAAQVMSDLGNEQAARAWRRQAEQVSADLLRRRGGAGGAS